MPLFLIAMSIGLAALFLVAGMSKLIGGLVAARKAPDGFGILCWLLTPACLALTWVEFGVVCMLPSTSHAQVSPPQTVVIAPAIPAGQTHVGMIVGQRALFSA